MSDETTDEWGPAKVLVPVHVLEGQALSEGLVDLFTRVPVVLLGVHVVPEQTAPGQARMQFEEKALAKLEEAAEPFEETGGPVTTRLVFTPREGQTIDRVAREEGCTAILLPNPVGDVEHLLVPIRGEVGVEDIAGFVAALLEGTDTEVTILHVAEPHEDPAEGGALLAHASVRLVELGVDEERITTIAQSTEERPLDVVAEMAEDHDAVVMGEGPRTWRRVLFGVAGERLARETLGPVVLVRHDWVEHVAEEAREDAGEGPRA